MTARESKLLLAYLNPSQPFEYNSTLRNSSLIAGLKDCRKFSCRNVETGKYDSNLNNCDIGCWLSAVGYFIILDQLGSCFRKDSSDNTDKNENSIRFAIKEFGFDLLGNDDNKIDALIALRNAFTHDFNLLNIPNSNKLISPYQHKFKVLADIQNSWIVQLPLKSWDGNIELKDFNNGSDSTIINLYQFGNMVENIYSRICLMLNKGELGIQPPITTLINKYTFIISKMPLSDGV